MSNMIKSILLFTGKRILLFTLPLLPLISNAQEYYMTDTLVISEHRTLITQEYDSLAAYTGHLYHVRHVMLHIDGIYSITDEGVYYPISRNRPGTTYYNAVLIDTYDGIKQEAQKFPRRDE